MKYVVFSFFTLNTKYLPLEFLNSIFTSQSPQKILLLEVTIKIL